MNKLIVAPFDLHAKLLQLIAREAENARRGLPARIIAKLTRSWNRNSSRRSTRASQAGVKIDLIVRGICCLRPGVPGLSENITVRSIVDRFLEHSRIFYFENACQPEVFVGSADWMPRNLFRRIEVVFPIEDGILRDRIINEILGVTLADNVKARRLGADGIYLPVNLPAGETPRRSQMEFIALAAPKTAVKTREYYPRMELAPRPFPQIKKAQIAAPAPRAPDPPGEPAQPSLAGKRHIL